MQPGHWHIGTLAHVAQRLAPEPDERVLNLGTGTDWTACNLARTGVHLTAVNIAPGLLRVARSSLARKYRNIGHLLDTGFVSNDV